MNRSKRKVTKDTNESILKLTIKSAIVIYLEKFSTLISQNSIQDEDKQRILDENQNLLQELINLPSENEIENSSKKIKTRKNSIKAQLVVNLDNELRLRIIGKLLEIKDQLRRGLETIKEEDKMNLVKEMFEINQDLSKLTLKTVEIEEDQLAKDELLIDKLNRANLEIENLKETLSNKIQEIDQFKIKEADKSTKEKRFEFQVPNLSKFFTEKSSCRSDLFYCGDLAWRVRVTCKDYEDCPSKKTRHLKFYLCCENNFDDLNCETNHQLILINQLNNENNKVKTMDFKFNSKSSSGRSVLFNETELLDVKNGWIKNDAIKLQVYLIILN